MSDSITMASADERPIDSVDPRAFLADGHGGQVKAVLFDLDGTLYDPKPLRGRMLAALLGRVARGPVSGLRILRTLKRFRRMREDLRALGDSAPSLDETQFAEPARVLGVPSSFVRKTVEEWMYRKPLPLVGANGWADLRETLTQVKGAGLGLGVFSDYPPADKLRALGIHDLFDVQLAATDPEVNAFKPHPSGFLRGAECLGLAPTEVLYVGDRLDVDGRGAEAAGMACVILGDGSDGSGLGQVQAPSPKSRGHRTMARFGELVEVLGIA